MLFATVNSSTGPHVYIIGIALVLKVIYGGMKFCYLILLSDFISFSCHKEVSRYRGNGLIADFFG